jgi:rod shape-determining protein MreD
VSAVEEEDLPRRRIPVAATVVPVVALVVAVYLEVALAIDARVLGAVPELALIVLVAIALRFGALAGAVAGFAAGLLLDLAVQGPLGASALVLTPLGWAAGAWAERRRRVSLGMAVIVLAATTALALLGDALVALAIEGQGVGWGTFWLHAAAALAVTVLIGIPVLALLRRICGVPAR